MYLRNYFFVLVTLISNQAIGSEAWSFGVACPSAGSQFRNDTFLASNTSGFSASGTCTRTSSRFTKFAVADSAGGNLRANEFYGLHTGDVLIMPPLLDTDLTPLFSVVTKCPWNSKSLNWLYVKWGAATYSLTGGLVIGSGSYDVSTGMTVDGRYDVEGNEVYSGSVALPGACSSGVYQLDGVGDRSGSIYLNVNGSGVFQPSNGRAMFFFPQRAISAGAQVGNRTFRGIVFDTESAANTRQVTASSNPAGDVITFQPYEDVELGQIDAGGTSFTETISLSSFNSPRDGMLFGTVTRTGFGAGTSKIACIAKEDVNLQIICTGESPADADVLYTVSLVAEGVSVLGQPTPNSLSQREMRITNPGSGFSDGTRFFVTDATNNRVLVWNTVPASNNVAPNFVLGQPNLTTNDGNEIEVSARSMDFPSALFSDGTRLFVADTSNNRVLIWNTVPTSNHAPADIVLGQPDMTSRTANNGGISGQTLNQPRGIYSDGTKLFVADSSNNRVLIWNSLPTSNGQAANVVLGQPNKTSSTQNNGGVSAQSLYGPYSIYVAGTRLFVADIFNHRVLIWNTIPTADRTAAALQLGQPNMTSRTQNNGGISAQTLSSPNFVHGDGTRLVIADAGNHRVLLWSSLPTVNRQGANLVLGPADMTTYPLSAPPTSQSLIAPNAVHINGSRLYVTDSGNERVLIWTTLPVANQAAANLVVGQPDLMSSADYQTASADSLEYPTAVHSDGTRYIVSDYLHSRVLIWNAPPSVTQQAADIVLGQPDMNSVDPYNGGVSSQSLAWTEGVHANGNRLFVVDGGAHRVLIWNTFPTANRQAADVVVGQANMTASNFNSGGASAQTMFQPHGVTSDGTRLIVSDSGNHRVLIWNTIPTSNGQAADVVLGQANMSSITANSGGVSAQSLWVPRGVHTDGTRLFVADRVNNRILIWNTIPTVSHQAADVVLGQPDMSSNSANASGVTAQTLNRAAAVFSYGNKLMVSDTDNNRILFWNNIPTVNQVPADAVLGQAGFTTNSFYTGGGISAQSFSGPRGLYSDGLRVFAADPENSRVLALPIP